MASGSQNMTTYNARTVTGSNSAASPAGALLLSGEGRANDATGDTWIFLDSAGGTDTPWGIKHDQANNKIQIFGAGTNSVWTRMNTGDTYIGGSLNTGSTLTVRAQNTAHEGGEIILSPATDSFSTVHIDAYDSLFRLHDGTNERFKVNISSGNTTINGNLGIGTDYAVSGGSYKLYVNGSTYFNGDTTHNGIDYFANGTTYYINNSAVAYLSDLRAAKVRLSDNWIGFYQNANAGGNRYGYISVDANRMYFRKENGVSTYHFDFGGHIYTNSNIYAPTGSIWAGTNGNTAAERQIGVQSGAGQLYMYSQAGSTAGRGIYTPAHGSGTARSIFSVNTDNRVYFADSYNGTGTALAYSQSGLAASAITWLTCWNGYELRAISKAEVRNAVVSAGLYWANVAVSSSSSTTTTPSFGTCYSTDLRGANVRLVSDWVGFYQNANAGGNRYGYIECNANRMYFRKENSSSQNEYFDFGSRIYTPSISCGYTNTSYAMSAGSFICNSWIRTVGGTGWYNETYGGGWYMVDSTYIRNFGSKQVYLNAQLGVDATLRLWNNTRQITRASRSVSWISGRDSALMREDDASGYHGVVMTKTVNGAWTIGNYNSSGWYNYLLFSYTSDSNYNAGTNTATTIRMRDSGVVESAMWNDYAEYRKANIIEPGRVVVETGNDDLQLCNQRLAAGGRVISDTYGFAIGQTKDCQTPIAVSGRVLVYPYKNRNKFRPGDAVCTAPNGTVDVMTRKEIILYPERIIGTVSAVPTYETWYGGGNYDEDGDLIPIPVHGRIWIYVR